jgi:hypothetical protein
VETAEKRKARKDTASAPAFQPRGDFPSRPVWYHSATELTTGGPEMPTYDYRCPANGQVVEVIHKMSERLSSWAELCERAGIEPGDTPADAPVEKLATGGNIIHSTGSGAAPMPSCPTGGCCSGGMCGLE